MVAPHPVRGKPQPPPPSTRPRRDKCGQLGRLTLHRTAEFIKAIYHVLADFVVGFSKQPNLLLTLFLLFLGGLLLTKVGQFIIDTSGMVGKILDVLAEALKLLNDAWQLVVPTVNFMFKAVASVYNDIIDVINDIPLPGVHVGSGHDIRPLVLPSTLPIQWAVTLGIWYDMLGNMAVTCAPFTSIVYECLFPFRYMANDHVCPLVRHTWGTFVHGPFSFFTGFLFFDDDPNGGNCANPPQFCICFACYIGLFVAFGLVGFVLFVWRFPAIMMLCLRLAEEVVAIIRLVFFILCSAVYVLFRSSALEAGPPPQPMRLPR